MTQAQTITIRVGWKEFKALNKLFPSMKGESMVNYFRRYVQAMKEQENGKR